MRNQRWITTAFIAATLGITACGSSSGGSPGGSPSSGSNSGPASTATTVKTAKVGGATVLTNAKGFTLYSFAPDTSTRSNCTGTCATYWPPVQGPVAASHVIGTFGTIKRSDGSIQATFDGRPLYTYAGDTAPGQAKGNGLNASGGLWHEATTSGSGPPAGSSSSGSGGGYGY